MGSGLATLGDREVPVAAGAAIYVPQGQWHGLRTTIRTTADAAALRKKHGIVCRDR